MSNVATEDTALPAVVPVTQLPGVLGLQFHEALHKEMYCRPTRTLCIPGCKESHNHTAAILGAALLIGKCNANESHMNCRGRPPCVQFGRSRASSAFSQAQRDLRRGTARPVDRRGLHAASLHLPLPDPTRSGAL